ncbi:hypothetical protein BpHYR1_034643 [Brachionus plicatilis]|uniref:RNA-directed DNA polymerase from mobile element jockey-like n=1 Tax=Brachionus plicatilis TaxID=10195 RepID=A0A3M7R6E0_BRAPC|nr:hypothetical protein BpHYR1_034643 [Brachionus plicatilis]
MELKLDYFYFYKILIDLLRCLILKNDLNNSEDYIELGQLPKSWKIASITMIPNKSSPTQDPNYRPISMTSCLANLLENEKSIKNY